MPFTEEFFQTDNLYLSDLAKSSDYFTILKMACQLFTYPKSTRNMANIVLLYLFSHYTSNYKCHENPNTPAKNMDIFHYFFSRKNRVLNLQ